MAENIKENIMSTELAIRRELSYREKIASTLSETEMAELLPLKVPNSIAFTNPYPSPMKFVQQNSASPPRTGPERFSASAAPPNPSNQEKSPMSRPGFEAGKAASSSLNFLQNKQPQAFDNSNRPDTFCRICKVSCSSLYNYKQHMKGQKHKAKLHFPKLNSNGMDGFGPTKIQQPRCNLCQICCTDETGLNLHLNGQKHKAKLQNLEVEEKGKTLLQFWCELCQVPCTNEETFQLHLKGKNHAAARKCVFEQERRTISRGNNVVGRNIFPR